MLNSTITALFIWINSHLGSIGANYEMPPYHPEIKFVDQKELSEMACERPCPVVGWYPTKNQIKGNRRYLILIGPEGGFSSEEVQLAENHNFEQVLLGDSRLRTETAGIIACNTIHLFSK